MNAVEVESALADLAESPYDQAQFPFQFLEAFGNKKASIDRLRKSSGSDVEGGVLLKGDVHVAICEPLTTITKLTELRESPATKKLKAKFLVATDGIRIDAEDLVSGEVISCDFKELPDRFGFFLPLAGITTMREIKESPIDVRATGRLNKLYMALLDINPEWGSPSRQGDMNHFMARLIFCFFAEDTNIFAGEAAFTRTIDMMSASDGSNTHEVIEAIFKAMNVRHAIRPILDPRLPTWADAFPYVNGGLFSGSTEVPRFNRTAKSFLIRAGELDWKMINPDIFGSMIQAVANADERSNLGMHYTSVPNILKVLNPLFLDDLRAQLEAAGHNGLKLLNLRKRLARIRVFDPACGSANFLVIAYKQLREIEAVINQRRSEQHLPTVIPLTNFRGIEINSFSAEIARLSLIITEFQCDVLYRGQQDAITEFLPLQNENWIVCGNALRLDWLQICPPSGTASKIISNDLFDGAHEQSEIDFSNTGGETYICGNPPYIGDKKQNSSQRHEMMTLFSHRCSQWRSLDYVAGWFIKASDYCKSSGASSAFVSTNSICQGQQASLIWPLIFNAGGFITFAYPNFKWQNLAAKNAGVTVVIVGISNNPPKVRKIYREGQEGSIIIQDCANINAYLLPGESIEVVKSRTPISDVSPMTLGNVPYDGGNLLLSSSDVESLNLTSAQKTKFIKRFHGSAEFIRGIDRYCLWIMDSDLDEALSIPSIAARIDRTRRMRLSSTDEGTRAMGLRAHQMRETNICNDRVIVVPRVSSENRPFLPVGLADNNSVIGDKNYAIYDAPLWNMALIASKLHWVWVGTVCVRMRTDFSYGSTIGWNTFPVPTLTENNKEDLTRCAEDILLAREQHFPKSIADLYDPETMPENLRQAHERNDEVIERIYIGRRFKNDSERLEKLFDLYTKMTKAPKTVTPGTRAKRATT